MNQDARERVYGYLDVDNEEELENELEELLGYHPSTAQVNAIERQHEIEQEASEPGETGGGVVQDSKGKFFGSKDHIIEWVDRWGNVMGYNSKTGERRKLVESR